MYLNQKFSACTIFSAHSIFDSNSWQILRHQINAQQNRLARLQEIVQEIDAEVNSSESAKEAIQIETLADRWEALVQITDVQAQRVSCVSK